jgi:IgGFc binding protein/Bacterial Ig-like domain (group 2)
MGWRSRKLGLTFLILYAAGFFWISAPARAQLNDSCTVSVLNRNVTAQPDGTWVIPNIPANQGRVRARATCIKNGATLSGQSDLFLVPANGAVNVKRIQFGTLSPIPDTLSLSLASTGILQVGSTAQITVRATYPDGTTANVSAAAAGTDYSSGNSSVATVSPDGLVTAVSNGTALITTFNEGTSGYVVVNVGGPPTVTITSPVNGTTVIQGAALPVLLQVTGGPIAAVSLLANGQTVATTSSSPYQFTYSVPTGGPAPIILTATAVDVSGTIANSAPVTVSTEVDPLTTVVGSVVDSSGIPLSGASVSCQGVTGKTGSNGGFSIASVPTAQNSVVCTASFTNASGVMLSGSSLAVTPVRAGTTDVGQIVLGSLTSRGTDFWMAFQNFPEGSGAQLSIVSETTAHFTLTAPGFSTQGSVTPTSPQTITLPNTLQITSDQTTDTKGIHLVSDAELSATFFYSQDGTHDAYLAIPTSSLGKEYFAASFIGGPAEFVVTAALDNTSVAITPTCNSLTGSPAGTGLNVALNHGQSYQYECSGDVTGSHIVSTQPVSVVSGNGCSFIPAGATTCDITSEMMFPVASLYGTDFYAVAFLDTAVRILAARDATSVTVDDGTSTTTYSLGSGQFKEIQNGTLGLAAYHITSNNPITVLQFGGQINVGSGSPPIGGPSELQIVPTHAFRTEFLLASSATNANFVILVVPNAAVSSVKLNGAPLAQGVGFFPLPGGLYQWTFYPVFSESVFTANAPFGAYSAGFGVPPFGSYSFPVAF